MWNLLVRLILRNRPGILVVIGILTVLMAWQGIGVKLSYDGMRMLPANDSAVIDYDDFRKRFGEDGSVIVIGVENPDMFKLDELVAWYDLSNDMSKIDGVNAVTSITKAANIVKNDSLRKFEFLPLMPVRPTTQAEADFLQSTLELLKFYHGLLYNPETDAYLLAVTLDKNKINDESRLAVTDDIVNRAKAYSAITGHKLHYSGLPYIRTVMTRMIKNELFCLFFFQLELQRLFCFYSSAPIK